MTTSIKQISVEEVRLRRPAYRCWPLALLVLASLLSCWVDYSHSEWYWPSIRAGEYWRLLSAHLAHLGWQHAVMNMAALVLLMILFEHISAKRWLFAMVVSVLAVNIGLWIGLPVTHSYVGLSGVLHGLILFGLLESLAAPLFLPPSGGQRQIGFLTLMVIALFAKLAVEQLSGPDAALEQLIGGEIWVDSHLFGAFGGGLAALFDIVAHMLAPLFKSRLDDRRG
jgi:rhomboid family GlyGly-CTERM serine protease